MKLKLQWLISAWLLLYFQSLPGVNSFLFREKNIHHVVNDPFQVRKNNITRENLFSWLNMKNHVKFRLWTRKNPKLAHEIKIGDMESVRTSNFDRRRLTKIIVHGYAHSANEIYLEDWIVSLRDAYLHLADLNIIIIDYTLFALPWSYWSAAPDLAADQLSELVKFLHKNGEVTLEGLHMMGFSWGAHIAGIAGGNLGGRVGRITGLDPAQPNFRLVDNDRRLDKSDAIFVDIIHTNGGRAFMEGHLGLGNPLGHVDYYPNSGRAQPGCNLKWIELYSEIECDHARSVNFFAESIVSPVGFPACKCDNWDQYVIGECPCGPEDMVFMGEHAPHSTRGKFYLFTRDKKPYGLGTTMNIQLPDIDKYDPDWNNTGYHHHLLPFVNKQQHNIPQQYYNQPQTATDNLLGQVETTEDQVNKVQWEPQGTFIIKSNPVYHATYIDKIVEKPSNVGLVSSYIAPANFDESGNNVRWERESKAIATSANKSIIAMRKRLILPNSRSNFSRFTQQLLYKMFVEHN